MVNVSHKLLCVPITDTCIFPLFSLYLNMSSSKNKQTEPPRKLTIQDLAFGMGRKVTDEEWELHLKETAEEDKQKGYSVEEVTAFVKKELKKRNTSLKKTLSEI